MVLEHLKRAIEMLSRNTSRPHMVLVVHDNYTWTIHAMSKVRYETNFAGRVWGDVYFYSVSKGWEKRV